MKPEHSKVSNKTPVINSALAKRLYKYISTSSGGVTYTEVKRFMESTEKKLVSPSNVKEILGNLLNEGRLQKLGNKYIISASPNQKQLRKKDTSKQFEKPAKSASVVKVRRSPRIADIRETMTEEICRSKENSTTDVPPVKRVKRNQEIPKDCDPEIIVRKLKEDDASCARISTQTNIMKSIGAKKSKNVAKPTPSGTKSKRSTTALDVRETKMEESSQGSPFSAGISSNAIAHESSLQIAVPEIGVAMTTTDTEIFPQTMGKQLSLQNTASEVGGAIGNEIDTATTSDGTGTENVMNFQTNEGNDSTSVFGTDIGATNLEVGFGFAVSRSMDGTKNDGSDFTSGHEITE